MVPQDVRDYVIRILRNRGYTNVRLACSQRNITVTYFWVACKDGKTDVVPDSVISSIMEKFSDPFDLE